MGDDSHIYRIEELKYLPLSEEEIKDGGLVPTLRIAAKVHVFHAMFEDEMKVPGPLDPLQREFVALPQVREFPAGEDFAKVEVVHEESDKPLPYVSREWNGEAFVPIERSTPLVTIPEVEQGNVVIECC